MAIELLLPIISTAEIYCKVYFFSWLFIAFLFARLQNSCPSITKNKSEVILVSKCAKEIIGLADSTGTVEKVYQVSPHQAMGEQESKATAFIPSPNSR
ncbi:hypothetical protein DP117_14780 [Brasilonema sp. UFV-L1]|nr:hypothetical protein [Brasilonema sp. UFV-L1]